MLLFTLLMSARMDGWTSSSEFVQFSPGATFTPCSGQSDVTGPGHMREDSVCFNESPSRTLHESMGGLRRFSTTGSECFTIHYLAGITDCSGMRHT